MKRIAKYRNGNYTVHLFNDGTKFRICDEDELNADFPENIDLCISKKCHLGCSFCHESATPDGKEAAPEDLEAFIHELPGGIELAIGGGALTECSDNLKFALAQALIPRKIRSFFLSTSDCSVETIFANATINQEEIGKALDIDAFNKQQLFSGLGVSFRKPDDTLLKLKEFYDRPGHSLVIHTINGITKPEDYKWLIKNDFKFLILGYKDFGRGVDYLRKESKTLQANQKWLEDNILDIVKSARLVSFDNLAIEQLHMKDKLSKEEWERFYMGEDGTATMYVDLVNKIYGVNSTQDRSTCKSFDPQNMDIVEMFKEVKKMKKEYNL